MSAKQQSDQITPQPFRHNQFLIFILIKCLKNSLFFSLAFIPMFQQIAGMPLATALDGNLCILPLEIFRDVKNKPTLSFVRFITWFLHHYFFFVVVTSFTTRKAKMSWKQSILCSPELWEYVVLFLQILIVLKDMEVDVCMWGRYSVNKTSAELPARHQLNYRWFLGLSCFQSYFGKSLLTSTYTTRYQNCFGETSPVFKRSWQ